MNCFGQMRFPLLLRAIALLLAGLVCAPVAARAGGEWDGSWETHWRGGGVRLVLEQDGDRVTGRYPLYEGRIEATANGRHLTGRWIEGEHYGHFEFVMARDAQTFAGRYNGGEWWTGERAQRLKIINPVGLGSPRDAVIHFVSAGNVARTGMEDAWGVAGEAIWFDPSTNLSQVQRLLRVRQLFALVDLTTFSYWTLPQDAKGDIVTIALRQPISRVALELELARDPAGDWRIRMPDETSMLASRKALLEAFGGKAPTADAFRRLQNPRDAMRAFLTGMADWNGEGRVLAMSTLDLSDIPSILQESHGALVAHYLRRVLDHIGLVGLQSIPNDGSNRDAYVHFVHDAGRIVIAPKGSAADSPWLFTAQTVADIDRLYLATETLPPPMAAPGWLIPSHPFFTVRDVVKTHADFLLARVVGVEYWQVAAVLMLMMTAMSLGTVLATIALWLLRRVPGIPREQSRLFFWSLAVGAALLLISPFPSMLGVPTAERRYALPLAGVIGSVALGTAAWHLLRVIADFLGAMAQKTSTPTDDILVSFTLAAARLAVVVGVALSIASFLSVSTTNILAGLGIGGLAFAFASRETLSNVFGAGILVTDRPFRRGDWIKAGDVEGAIEAVGIRSTRVRTAQDSVVVVPNGKLSDSTIDNLGTRRRRLMRIQLVVTSGGTPERVEAFTKALRQRLEDDTEFVATRTEVGVSSISAAGIEITVSSYLDVASGDAERAARHAFLVDVLRLAELNSLTLGPTATSARKSD